VADVLVVSLPPYLTEGTVEAQELMWQGLQQVVGSSLGVRICNSQQQGISMMQQFEQLRQDSGGRAGSGGASACVISGGSLRIWPLDVLRVTCTRPVAFTSLLSRFASPCNGTWQAVDPAACFSISAAAAAASSDATLFQRALYKACQMWILTDNDVTAKNIMERVVIAHKEQPSAKVGGVGCITAVGNRHIIGGMTITSNSSFVDQDSRNSRKNSSSKQSAQINKQERSQPPVSYLKEYHVLNQQIAGYRVQLEDLKKTVKWRSQAHIHIVQLIQAKQQLEDLRLELSAVVLAQSFVQQQLAVKTHEREHQQGLRMQASEQLDETVNILSTLNNCNASSSDTGLLVSSYNAKQLQLCKAKESELESRLSDLDLERGALEEGLEDIREDLEGLLLAQQQNDLRLPKLREQVAGLRHKIMDTEEQRASLDITLLKEQRQKGQEQREKLQTRVDGLEDAVARCEDATKNMRADCSVHAHDCMTKLSLLDNDDEEEKEQRINTSRHTRRVQQLKQKQTVKTESDLMTEKTLLVFRDNVLEEVQSNFADGHSLAEHLARNPPVFLQSVEVELRDLITSREQLRGQWKTLQREFLSLQRQQQQACQQPTKQKRSKEKQMRASVIKTKKKRVSRACSASKQSFKNRRSICTTLNDNSRDAESSDEDYCGGSSSEDEEQQQGENASSNDLDLEAHEVQIDQRKLLLQNLQAKFQQECTYTITLT
jgi:hypothetical protein